MFFYLYIDNTRYYFNIKIVRIMKIKSTLIALLVTSSFSSLQAGGSFDQMPDKLIVRIMRLPGADKEHPGDKKHPIAKALALTCKRLRGIAFDGKVQEKIQRCISEDMFEGIFPSSPKRNDFERFFHGIRIDFQATRSQLVRLKGTDFLDLFGMNFGDDEARGLSASRIPLRILKVNPVNEGAAYSIGLNLRSSKNHGEMGEADRRIATAIMRGLSQPTTGVYTAKVGSARSILAGGTIEDQKFLFNLYKKVVQGKVVADQKNIDNAATRLISSPDEEHQKLGYTRIRVIAEEENHPQNYEATVHLTSSPDKQDRDRGYDRLFEIAKDENHPKNYEATKHLTSSPFKQHQEFSYVRLIKMAQDEASQWRYYAAVHLAESSDENLAQEGYAALWDIAQDPNHLNHYYAALKLTSSPYPDDQDLGYKVIGYIADDKNALYHSEAVKKLKELNDKKLAEAALKEQQ